MHRPSWLQQSACRVAGSCGCHQQQCKMQIVQNGSSHLSEGWLHREARYELHPRASAPAPSNASMAMATMVILHNAHVF